MADEGWTCRTCPNPITRPHFNNNWDLWCADCHAKARGENTETLEDRHAKSRRAFQKRIAGDGHRRRGNFT